LPFLYWLAVLSLSSLYVRKIVPPRSFASISFAQRTDGVMLAAYVPCSPFLYGHMASLRAKKLGGGGKAKKN
jgi:hypothetical protein